MTDRPRDGSQIDYAEFIPIMDALGIEYGTTVNDSDIRIALREYGHDPGKSIDASDMRRLVREYVGSLEGIDPSEVDPVAENIISGERSIAQAAQKFGAPTSGGSDGSPDAATDDDPNTLPGVLAGGQTIKVWSGDRQRFYQVYEFPPGSGQFVSYQFNDLDQVKATLGESPALVSWTAGQFQERVVAEAAAEEVVGLEGNWQGLTREMMRDAAEAAGVRDPGLVGRIASNAEMQQIMAQAIAGDWTEQQILAAQRQTDFWTEELYPGIESFYNQTQNPEAAWNEYRRAVTPALRQLGYEPDADGTLNSQVGRMLNNKIDADTFLSQVPVFIRATQNVQFAQTLDRWAERELGRNVEFQDWFDLMAGESAPEIERVAERARLAYEADQAQAGVRDSQIERLADLSDLSDQQARQVFSDLNRSVLALGESGLRRGGLSRDEILSAAAGIDPDSKRSIEEVRLLTAKLAKEEGLFDDQKASFYVGFDSAGRPSRPGLQSLAPESG